LLSSSSSSRPSLPLPLHASPSPPPAARKHHQSVIDLTSDSDDEIPVVATHIKQEPRTPHRAYKCRITTSTPPSLSHSLDTSTSFLSLPSPGLLSPFPTVLMPWKKWLHYIIYTATPLYLDLLYNGFVPWIKLHLILFLSLC
jgi:hypothetical protein